MVKRMWAIGAAAVLLGAAVVTVASTVQGLEFERQGALTEAGSVSALDWRDADGGKVRFALAPIEGATAPHADLSLFTPSREHLGTFSLDAAWTTLDYQIVEPGRYIVVVHSAIDASVEVLTQQGREVSLASAPVRTEELVLFEGAGDHVAHQVAIERTARDLHMGVVLAGTATDLRVEAVNGAGETVLMADAPLADAPERSHVAAQVTPESFSEGNLLVRFSATSLSGTLTLELVSFGREAARLVPANEPAAPAPPADPHDEEDKDVHAGALEGAYIADIEPGEPIAFRLPAGVASIFVVSGDACGEGILFASDDTVLGVGHINSEEGAIAWDDDAEDGEELVAAEIPVTGEGEFVLVLVNAWQGARVWVPGIEEGSIDVRPLEIEDMTATVEQSGSLPLLGSREPATAEVELAAGLFGFSYWVQGADLERDVTLTGPDGEVLYDSSGFVSAFGFELMQDANGTHPLAGPSGTYTIETSGDSVLPGSVEFTLLTYVR